MSPSWSSSSPFSYPLHLVEGILTTTLLAALLLTTLLLVALLLVVAALLATDGALDLVEEIHDEVEG
jgi:hypothetical protein